MICGRCHLTLFSPDKFGRHCNKAGELAGLGAGFFCIGFCRVNRYWAIIPAMAMTLSLLLTSSSNCSSTCSRFSPSSS